jgi:indolepyruvate ferredoxin oxidoreductase
MNSPLTPAQQSALSQVTIDDKYTLEKGRVYMSGTQALVRLPMLQQQRDRRAGLNTAGYVSGYRGSPLGAVDQQLWKAKKYLGEHGIVFQPGVNEELAATAVWGSQQTGLWPGAKHDGVFGMWYGKGPGVDRCGDVFKHGNSAGSSPCGGVLLLAGDDHAAKSSSVAHQSEHALIAAGIPVLYPSNVQEYLDYGLHGWALSRYSGLWVGMKCVTDVVESTASIDVDPDRVEVVIPSDFAMPEGGLNIRWPDPPLAQEARLVEHKWYAALAYIRANKLNKIVVDSPRPKFGIVAAGKAYLDVRQALADLGLDDAVCANVGIRVLKLGCVWPLDPQIAREFATGLEEILVVEEKRQIVEYALKEELYNWNEQVRPKVYGKFDERDNQGGEWSVPRADWLLPARHELSPALIAQAIARRLDRNDLPVLVRARIHERVAIIDAKEKPPYAAAAIAERRPWFCSGCPHNTSTRVPEGSRATAGIGCHYMAMGMDRETDTFSQMGGEGVPWLGQMHFTDEKHIFVNLGDGTYFHSGHLAIRAAVAARANVTYKILYNDAVAMTGGQPVDGVLTVPQIAHQLQAEGVAKIVIVTDEPEKYTREVVLPDGTGVHHRDELDAIQKSLRTLPGVSILIYDQTCATEKRRRRTRGKAADPARRVFINDAVCEGCGDCSVQSNCLSVEPLATPLGVKRKINQSSCNKDFSCVKGFCPSFVTAEGATMRKPAAAAPSNGLAAAIAALPYPASEVLDATYSIVVTGVGGTGVVTVGALLGMAAHLERKGVSVLDMTGLAQKGGAVVSHVQIAPTPAYLHATRVGTGEARLVIGCDALVSASPEVLSKTREGLTRAVVNTANTPTADFVKNPGWRFPAEQAQGAIRASVGEQCDLLDAHAAALTLLGDAIYANPLLLGFAWQRGWVPLAYESLMRAIELNNVAVEKNQRAFDYGRYLAHHGADSLGGAKPAVKAVPVALHRPESLDAIVTHRTGLLAAYQNDAYAQRYQDAVTRMRKREQSVGDAKRLPVTTAVARNLAKLMAYKDEYEVARLYADPAFLDKLRTQFDGEPGKDYKLQFHLAPPMLAARDAEGQAVKRRYGPWMLPAFRVLSKLKGLRGTVFDPFGHTEERRAERRLVDEYFEQVAELCQTLTSENAEAALKLASLPDQIRGYGRVKEKAMAAAAVERERLRAEYRQPAPAAAIGPPADPSPALAHREPSNRH